MIITDYNCTLPHFKVRTMATSVEMTKYTIRTLEQIREKRNLFKDIIYSSYVKEAFTLSAFVRL